jgi:hypothetical protein
MVSCVGRLFVLLFLTIVQRLGEIIPRKEKRDTRIRLFVKTNYARRHSPYPRSDNEFTQLMKGLQGERLRQAFRYLDKDQDGYITPEQFKRIILVCR